MGPINRRTILSFGFLTVGAGTLATTAGFGAYRRRQAPRTLPMLTEEHLANIRAMAVLAPPEHQKILFVGNSNTLRHLIPAQVQALSVEQDRHYWAATAVANGARLKDTVRLPALRAILRDVQWDALVLQDFSSTPLRGWDRRMSAKAIARIAALAPQAQVVLFPSWPDAADHPNYSGSGALWSARAADPAEFAEKSDQFYTSVARENGFTVAPIVSRWMDATATGRSLYAHDLHHSNAAGAALVARVLLETLNLVLAGEKRRGDAN